MARVARVLVRDLAAGLVLAPERYDPARRPSGAGQALAELVTLVTAGVRPDGTDTERYLVFDTGDARAGFLQTERTPVPAAALGSTKRVFQPGDVLISRLRPYLRQVAWVDPALAVDGARLCCSTEFYVLRGREGAEIAFLVPFLLSPAIQLALAAGQEGGHHPRFDRSLLLELPVATAWLADRQRIGAEVVAAVAMLRQGRQRLRGLEPGER